MVLPSRQFLTPVTKSISLLMIPAIFGAAVYQISIILNTILASFLETGSVSWLFYADRVAQLPIGIFTIALSSVLLPLLAKSASAKQNDDYIRTTLHALRYMSFVLIPTSTIFFLYAEPIVHVLFERGAFVEKTTSMTALALQGYAIGLWGISCQSILSRSFIAKKDPLTPALISLAALFIGFHVSIVLMGPIALEQTTVAARLLLSYQSFLATLLPLGSYGHVGLALGSSVTSIISFIIFLGVFYRRERYPSLHPFLKSTVIGLLGSGAVYCYSFVQFSDSIFINLPLTAVIYLVVSFLLQSQESKEIRNLLL